MAYPGLWMLSDIFKMTFLAAIFISFGNGGQNKIFPMAIWTDFFDPFFFGHHG
jgi:hypothetical protein